MMSAISFRFRAALIHFFACALVALMALMLVFKLWYPEPLYKAAGVVRVFVMMLAVDMVLGPMLTFIVCKQGKRTLVLDLLVIVILQLSALGYGLWTVAQGRPAWLVFGVDRFDMVRVVDLDPKAMESAEAKFRSPPLFGPKWAVAIPPADVAARNKMLFDSLRGGHDLTQRPDLYHSFESESEVVKMRLHQLDELEKYNSRVQTMAFLAKWPQADSWLPLMASAEPMVVLLNKEKMEILAVVDLRPW